MDNNLLNDRISRLKQWEQTESLNEILYYTLSSLHTYANDRFDSLTKEIRDESATNDDLPVIKVAVCQQDDVDKQIFLHPVAAQTPQNSPRYIATVFAKCDYPTIQKIMRQTFNAKIIGKSGLLQTRVELKYSMRYLKKLESLYYTFNENDLSWATVNSRYFYKFLDVYSIQEPIQSPIDEFEIDFTHYDKYILYDKELLWNIIPMTAPVAGCEPRPAYNAIQYEHMLKNLMLDEDKYLVCPLGDRFNVFRRGKEMFVRTYKKQLEQIDLLRVVSSEDAKSPLYLPLKSNKRSQGLVDAMAKKRHIPTWGEAERIIHSLGEQADIRLVDIKPLPCSEESLSHYKGIDYNYFREENMVSHDRKLLLFTFDITTDDIWAYETMYYALSELQLYFFEYRCIGEMV